MKKSILFLLLVAVFGAVHAQSKLGFGVKAGLNLATQHEEDPNSTTGNLLGYNAGAYFNYFLMDYLAVQPEFLFNLEGTEWGDSDGNVKDYLTYLEIPLLVRFQPIELINVHAGPQIGFLLKAKQKVEDGGDTFDVKDLYKNGQLSFAIGAGLNLPKGLSFTFRYVMGLNDVIITDNPDYTYKWKNRVYQVSLAYKLIGR
jgi:hypothetical protein